MTEIIQDVFENEIAKITIDDTNKIIEIHWKKYANVESYKEVLETVLELVQKHSIKKMLADMRYIKTLRMEAQKWSEEELTPKIIKNGCTKFATVVPTDVFGAKAVDKMRENVDKSIIESDIFDDVSKARSWLKSQ